MPYNSTIIVKKKQLSCGHFDYNFSKGRCQQCAKIEDFNKKQEEEITKEGLSDVISDLDAIISHYVRLRECDKELMVKCYTCDFIGKWTIMQCGHYVSRSHLYLRHDLRNLKVQCEGCNVHKRGNLLEYARRLEIDSPGITEILYEEKQLVYHPSISELKQMIADYSFKVSELKKKLKI